MMHTKYLNRALLCTCVWIAWAHASQPNTATTAAQKPTQTSAPANKASAPNKPGASVDTSNTDADKNKNLKSSSTMKNIRYINLNQLVTVEPAQLSTSLAKWQDLFKGIQVELEPNNKELGARENAFNKERKEFEDMRASGLAKQEALAEKVNRLIGMENELKMMFQQFQSVAQEKLNVAQQIIMPEVDKAVSQVREEAQKAGNPIDIVLNGAAVFAGSAEHDITPAVKNILNAQYKADLAKKEQEAKNAPQNNNKNSTSQVNAA